MGFFTSFRMTVLWVEYELCIKGYFANAQYDVEKQNGQRLILPHLFTITFYLLPFKGNATMNRQRQLVDILNKWAYEYYVLDAPTVSDKEYDALYDELKKLEEQSGEVYPDSPTRRVGGEPIKAFEKHTHIARLFSLDKSVTEDEVRAFITRVEKAGGENAEYTVEYKFDGLTVCLTYDKGEFDDARQRRRRRRRYGAGAYHSFLSHEDILSRHVGSTRRSGDSLIRFGKVQPNGGRALEKRP